MTRGSVRRNKTGTGWESRWRLAGKQYSHTVKGTRKDAERWLTAYLAAQDAGGGTAPSRITVAAFLARWLAEIKQTTSPSMQRVYGQSARRWSGHIGAIKLQALTTLDVAQARDRLLEGTAAAAGSPRTARAGRPLSPKTVWNDLGALRTALGWALKMDYVSRNVALAVAAPKVERREVRPFSLEEAERLLAEMWAIERSETNMLALGLLLGVRTYSELGGMRRLDWDAQRRTLSLGQVLLGDAQGRRYLAPAGNSKHKPRLLEVPARGVPFIERQVAWVEQQHRLHGLGWNQARLLFPNPYGQSIARTTFYQVFKRVLAAAGLDGHIHMLRHSCASILLASGVHMKVVQEVLGHSNMQMTANLYSHLARGAVGSALDAAWSQAPVIERAQ